MTETRNLFASAQIMRLPTAAYLAPNQHNADGFSMSHGVRSPWLVLLALAFAIVTACSDSSPRTGLSVQLSWQSARLSPGHLSHVTREHVACAQCHDLSGQTVDAASPLRCASCHAKESNIRHAEQQAALRFGERVKADCTACHAFTGARNADGGSQASRAALDAGASLTQASPKDCVRCHASQQGNTPKIVVHALGACTSCHRPHEDSAPKPAPCVGCHEGIVTSHAAQGKSATQECTTCHEHQHAPASEAFGKCVTCHETTLPIVPKTALFASGHSQCVSCHTPHAFSKALAQPCRSCHANLHVLGESSVTAHQQCKSCHAPHDVRGSAERSCATCHANVHPDHPKVAGKSACVGCHDPHPTATHALESAATCSSCHRSAHSDKDFHQGLACTQCHTPHSFSLASTGVGICRNCHAQELARVALRSGHQRCANCHGGLPHQPTAQSATCSTCHAPEQKLVNRGHAACTSCHEPHSGAQAAACRSCHEAEARTAPSGHTRCITCHEPHAGSAKTAPACTTCHSAEGQSKHGQLGGGCKTCHEPHGPRPVISPPPCVNCHQSSQLGGLHQVPKHGNCSSCHGAHRAPSGLARAACETCHSERKAHFPNAARCTSCHLFGGGAK